MGTEKVGELFDEWAKEGRAAGMEKGHKKAAMPLLEGLRFEGGVRFLDLGCGNGWAGRFAGSQGARVRGIDASLEMINLANELAKKKRMNARFQTGDFADLPFDDGSFDVVWSMEAMYYAPDPDEVLREVQRVLTPGGTFHMLIDYYEENTASHSWPEDTGAPMVLRAEDEWARSLQVAFFQNIGLARLKLSERDAGKDTWKATEGTLYVSGRK
jgi:ubiquinone/menaquinone biosynthesis C-methylase UbiE